MTPRRLAVVGSGVAGLTAAYVASRTAQVTLYEADTRLGGHADTHLVPDAATGRDLAIDTGFIVHNQRTYPVLLRLFTELGIETQESEMSLSTSDEGTGLEWAGALGARGLFPTAANLRNPRYLRMLAEVPRFHREARRLLGSDVSDLTLREFLDRAGFSPYFRRHFMEPLVAAVWSCDPAVATDYPARYLFTFLQHHGMLGVFGSPAWRTVVGGSRSYVDRVAAAVEEAGGSVRLGSPVLEVSEDDTSVTVRTETGEERYDAVVVATHPAQGLALLADPTPVQRKLLEALPYSRNTALLHTDTRLLPRSRHAWASWNFRRPDVDQDSVLVTYDLTRLQRLPTPTRYLVTLGGEHLVDPATVIARRDYEHPLYTPTSVAARDRLDEVDTPRVRFAGAYHGWGFHEDGARSGSAAVEGLGLGWPERRLVPNDMDSAGNHDDWSQTAPPTPYRTTITHTRRTPFRRTFRHRSHLWVVDLDQLPEHRWAWLRGRFDARDHFDGRSGTIREGLDRYLATHGIDISGGRVLMAAHPRALGHCFNPISVFWCWRDRAATGPAHVTVVEVHNTYGGRHAYLVPTDARGAGEVDKELYVSPFHGTDGRYTVVAPPPDPDTGRLSVAVALRTDDGAPFTASVVGEPARRPPSVALSAIRGALLIRMHGMALLLRGLPVRPRPTLLDPTPPAYGPGARIARRLFRSAVGRLDVTVHLAAGTTYPAEVIGRGGRGAPAIHVHRPDELFARLARDQLIGFGEAYLTGAWDEGPDAPDGALGDFLTVLAGEIATLVPRPLQALRSAVVTRVPRSHRGDRGTTRANVAHHYDLSNDLFALFLDRTMSYSAALFDDPTTATAADLPAAQHRKIDRLLDQAGVGEGTRLLEIGTGWGELAIRATVRGASVRTITLSSEQLELARRRIADAGQADRVDVELMDYRALLDSPDRTAAYDAVVSVEMVEAVGWRYWPTYFRTLDHVLAPGGRAVLQAITMPHDRMLATRDTHTFITKYVFPGGALPSLRAIEDTAARHTRLRVVDRLPMGAHYDRTLRLWDDAFTAAAAEVEALGFDETFRRLWHFYLEYSRAGFASGYLDDHQVTLTREEAW